MCGAGLSRLWNGHMTASRGPRATSNDCNKKPADKNEIIKKIVEGGRGRGLNREWPKRRGRGLKDGAWPLVDIRDNIQYNNNCRQNRLKNKDIFFFSYILFHLLDCFCARRPFHFKEYCLGASRTQKYNNRWKWSGEHRRG